jgi:hypothetical protein
MHPGLDRPSDFVPFGPFLHLMRFGTGGSLFRVLTSFKRDSSGGVERDRNISSAPGTLGNAVGQQYTNNNFWSPAKWRISVDSVH